MRGTVRWITAVVGIALVTSLSAPAWAEGGTKLKQNDACNVVTAKQVKARFGGPVGAPVPAPANLSCTYAVGTDPAVAPGGTLTVIQHYPSPFATRVANAQAAVEDQLAVDQLSDQEAVIVPKVGKSAYINRTKGEILFAPTQRLAFIFNWAPAPAGTRLTPRQERQLIALARQVTARANKG